MFTRLGALAALATLASADAALATDDPAALVRSLYAARRAPATAAQAQRFLCPELARAYGRALKASEPGPLDFDWRYDAQDVEVDALAISLSRPQEGATPAVVEAHFANFGRPARVHYALCRRASGWRIVDVGGDGSGEPWTLRGLLHLSETATCR